MKTTSSKPKAKAHMKTVSSRPTVRKVRKNPSDKWQQLKLLAVAFILVVGAMGAWRIMNSSAAIVTFNAEQCFNRGRVYTGNTGVCEKYCEAGAGTYTVKRTKGARYDYCSGAVSTTVGSAVCAAHNRDYLSGTNACAKRWGVSQGQKIANAMQCKDNSYTYVVAAPYDYCMPAATANATGWTWPVPGVFGLDPLHYGAVTSRGTHKGIDIGATEHGALGATVVAAHSGTVTKSYWSTSCGGMMVLKAEGTPYWTGVQHLQLRFVNIGQYVKAGQPIGTIGNYGETTCSTTPGTFDHIHYSIEKGDWLSTYADPLDKSIDPCTIFTEC